MFLKKSDSFDIGTAFQGPGNVKNVNCFCFIALIPNLDIPPKILRGNYENIFQRKTMFPRKTKKGMEI
jgi:hypothetical protein